MIFNSGVSSSLKEKSFSKPKETKTRFLSSIPNKLQDRLEKSLQKKQARNYSNVNKDEIFATGDKLLETKCISTKQLRFLILKGLN